MIAVFVSSAVLGLLTLLLFREGADGGASKFAFGTLLLFTVCAPLASFSFSLFFPDVWLAEPDRNTV